jgi:hypothetical protein
MLPSRKVATTGVIQRLGIGAMRFFEAMSGHERKLPIDTF